MAKRVKPTGAEVDYFAESMKSFQEYNQPTDLSELIPPSNPIAPTIDTKHCIKSTLTEQATSSTSKDLIQLQSELTKRTTDKHLRISLEEYRQIFLQVPRIIDRKPVFVSASTREQLDRIVRQLGDRKMSVSGLIENLALNHLKTYGEDIEQWRKL